MRLSDAMMLGATLKRHVHFPCKEDDDSGCALQLALTAIGIKTEFPLIEIVKCVPHWDWIIGESSITIVQMNDGKRCRIEAIADYVRSVEPAEPFEGFGDPLACEEVNPDSWAEGPVLSRHRCAEGAEVK